MENNELVTKLSEELKKFEDKSFKVLFYTLDTQGMPSGSLTYMYETAYQLKELGYNVQMLHSEKEFVGVREWLGDKYADLPHYNIEKDNVAISPADILFIPEIFSSVMYQTKDLPCKRIAMLQNFSYLTEMTQPGATWLDYGVNECVTTSYVLSDRIKEVFPYVKTSIVRPSISKMFHKTDTPKKLIVNIVSKHKADVNAIVKPFFWKYPMFKWVCFRDFNGLPKEEIVKLYQEAAITIWIDDKTDFGYTPLEAMACGNIVMGKVPETIPEWLMKDGNVRDCGLWFYSLRDAYDLLADVIDTYIHNGIPDVIEKEADDVLKNYTSELQLEDIKRVYVDGFFEDRKKELTEALAVAKNNETKKD